MTDIQYDSRNIPIGTIGNSDHLSGSNGLSDYTTPTSYQPYQPTDSEATSSDSTKVFSSTSLYLKSSRYSEPQTTTLDDVTKQHSETPQETDSNEVTPSNVNKNGVDAAYTHQGIDANYGLHNTSIQTNEENNNIQLEQNNAVINNVTSNIDDNSVPSNVAVTDMNNGVPSSDIPNQSSTTGAHTAVSPSPPYMANDINNTAPIMGSNGIASTSVPSNNQAHEPTPVMNAPQNNNMQQNSFNTNTSVMTQQPITNGTTVTSSVNSGPPMTMSQKADPERNHPNNSLFIEHIKDMHNKAVEQVRDSVQIQQQNAPVNQMHQQPQMQYPQQQQQQQQQPQQLHQQQQQPLPLQQHPQIQQQQQPQIQQHQQPYMQPQIHQHQHQIAQQPQYQHPQPVEPVREIYQPQPTSQFQNRQQNHQPNVYVPSTQQTPVYYQNNSNNVVGEAQPKRLPQQNQGYEMVGPRGIDETLKIPLAMSNPISEDIFNESQSFGTQIKTLQDHLHSNQDGMSEQRFRSTIEKYIDEIRKSYLVVVKNSSQMQKKIDAQNEKIIELQQQIISAKSERIDTETNLRTKLEEKEKMVNQLEKDLVQEKERIITKLIQQEDNAKERGLSRASTPSENEFDHCRSPQQKMNDENDRQDHQHQQQFKSGLPVHRKLSAASKPPTIHKKKEDKEVSNEDKQPTTCSFPLLMNPMYPSQKLDGEPFKEVTKRITNVLHTIGHKIEFDCMKPSKNGGVIIFFVSYQHRNIAKAALENTVLQLKMKPVVLSPGELYGYYRPDNLVNKDRSSRSASPVRLATYRGKV